MEIANSNDDCYFFYYSSCTKGDECPYRHCVAALGTETVCTAWREGRCFRSNCKFRHMESRINRSSIPCYWENQPSGCRKPHCVFLHRKDRLTIGVLSEEQKLILPVSSQPHSPSAVDTVSESTKNEVVDSHSLSPSQRIQPVVVSLDEGEESDSESTASTPMKSQTLEIRNSKFSKKLFGSKTSDFGIKTLEQIKMERIHRESEHFYNTADKIDSSDLDENSELKRLDKLHSESSSFYSTADYNSHLHEVTPESREAELYQNASLYPLEMNNILHDNNEASLSPEEKVPNSNCSSLDDHSGDLRDILKKRRRGDFQSAPKLDITKKRVISLKKTSNVVGESTAVTITFEKETKEQSFSDVSSTNKKEIRDRDALNFRIKTLEEIRKEKERKIDHPEQLSPEYAPEVLEQVLNWEGDQCDMADESKENSFSNGLRTNAPKRKLKRKPIEVYKIPQKASKIDYWAMGDNIKLSQNSEAVTNIATTEDKALGLPIRADELSKGHQTIKSMKRHLSEDSTDAKFLKASECSGIKHSTLKAEPAKENIQTEGNSLEIEAAEEKRFKIIKSSPSSRRTILCRHNLSPVKSNGSSTDGMELAHNNMHEVPDKIPLQALNGSEHEIPCGERGSPKDLSIDTSKSSPQHAQTESDLQDNSDASLLTLQSPGSTARHEILTHSSVDDFEKLFSGDADLSPEEIDCTNGKNSEDIFLELEQMIQS